MCLFCFFFQAEDGIRDDLVTGVQTCALPISARAGMAAEEFPRAFLAAHLADERRKDRKSTRLNSSHQIISYAVFCLKKKKKKKKRPDSKLSLPLVWTI